jgi:N-acetylmuramoyl-L-alanine amidase
MRFHMRKCLVAIAATLAPALAVVPGLAAPPAVESAVQAAGVPVAVEAQLASDAGSARLAFTMSGPVTGRVSVLEKPDRIVVDLPEVNFQIPPEVGRKAKGLVKSFRYGMIGPGRSRIVIELASPALPVKAQSEPILGGAATAFVLELRKADRETYARSVGVQAPEPPRPVAIAPIADRRPVVVLDPGHGGIDTGAIGLNRTVEKDVVFAFARDLKEKLERDGRVRVVLTREGDSFVALGERVRIARAQGASLFVSIHADTLKVSPEVQGLTIYTNAERASDAESARLAEIENRADSAAGIESPEDVEEIAGILSDLTRRETRTYSHLFARTLVGQIMAASKLNKNPQRSAGFRVLRAPDVPSVLVELGYLSSKSDVELLTAAPWRDKATDSISAAITAFLAPRLAQQAQATQPAQP